MESLDEVIMDEGIDTNILDVSMPEKDIEWLDKSVISVFKDQLKKEINWMNAQELTVTFCPRMQLQDRMYLRNFLKMILKSALKGTVKDSIVYMFYEISPNGMFHYHGILSNITLDRLYKIRAACNRQLGFCNLRCIRYDDSYLNYMLKRYDREYENYENIESKYDICIRKNKSKK